MYGIAVGINAQMYISDVAINVLLHIYIVLFFKCRNKCTFTYISYYISDVAINVLLHIYRIIFQMSQ